MSLQIVYCFSNVRGTLSKILQNILSPRSRFLTTNSSSTQTASPQTNVCEVVDPEPLELEARVAAVVENAALLALCPCPCKYVPFPDQAPTSASVSFFPPPLKNVGSKSSSCLRLLLLFGEGVLLLMFHTNFNMYPTTPSTPLPPEALIFCRNKPTSSAFFRVNLRVGK